MLHATAQCFTLWRSDSRQEGSPTLNWVDLVILVLIAVSAATGIRKGAAMQLLSFGGFWAGFAIGSALAPLGSRVAHGTFSKAFVSLAIVFGTATVLGTAGRIAGMRIWGRIRKTRLGTLDAGMGAGISVVATLLASWLIGSMLIGLPIGQISDGIRNSRIQQVLTKSLPPAPSAFAQVRHLLNAAGFPDVFAELEPTPNSDVPLPNDPTVRAAVAAAGPSTVKIAGFGCGGIVYGSGFVVAPGLVVTNAHVVAGIRHPQIQDGKGSHRSTPIYFDPNFDMAVLKADGLREKPLQLFRSGAQRGQQGAALGFPGGGPFRAVPAAVLGSINALGRDIYGRSLSRRNVYQLQAEVHPGNSGGPLVRSDGTVMGVIFSASTVKPNVSYALRSDEVATRLEVAKARQQAVDTQGCAA